MDQQAEPNNYKPHWGTCFPGQIQPLCIYWEKATRSIPKATISKWSKQDTLDTNFLHVPALSLVLAGDIRYHDVHQWLVEATSGCLHRRPGTDCGPETGYRDRASHERPDAVDGISNVRASRNKYIRAFGELKEMSTDAAGLYQAMIRGAIPAGSTRPCFGGGVKPTTERENRGGAIEGEYC